LITTRNNVLFLLYFTISIIVEQLSIAFKYAQYCQSYSRSQKQKCWMTFYYSFLPIFLRRLAEILRHLY